MIFHLRVGVRVALRILAPVLAALFALYYIFKPEFFVYLAKIIFYESGPLALGLISAAVMLATAKAASSRVCYGICGWIRHLPSDDALNRRMSILAVFIAQTPVLGVLVFFAVLSSRTDPTKIPATLAGIVFLGLAAAASVVPTRKKRLRSALGLAACVLCASGRWPLVAAGIICIGVLDRISGPLISFKKRPGFQNFWKPFGLPTVISGRAIGWKIMVPYILALGILFMTRLFLLNNGPDARLSSAAVRFGGMIGLAAFLAFSASLLASKRPPWPWIRTLPWSSGQRLFADAFFLGTQAGILLIPVFFIDGRALLPIAASLPLAVVRAAGAIRQDRLLRFGAWGKVLSEGFFEALLLGLWPWTAAVFLILSVPAFKEAVGIEQKQKVSQWLEMHHLAAGDSLSWSEG